MIRKIILDTETTGLDPNSGHRIVEIGCIELINLIPSGRVYHQYINPERSMPKEAFAVHGLSAEFLSSHPTFQEIAKSFVDFVGDDGEIVIHNANFDVKFLDWELAQVGYPLIDRGRVEDTLEIARKKHPGAKNNLDALCKRYGINNAHREYHGALLDSQLLADVYLYLMGGRQPSLTLEQVEVSLGEIHISHEPVNFESRLFEPSELEVKSHIELVEQIKNSKWLAYS